MAKDEEMIDMLKDIWIDGYEVDYYADNKHPASENVKEWLKIMNKKET